jgi:hypothetical protein
MLIPADRAVCECGSDRYYILTEAAFDVNILNSIQNDKGFDKAALQKAIRSPIYRIICVKCKKELTTRKVDSYK